MKRQHVIVSMILNFKVQCQRRVQFYDWIIPGFSVVPAMVTRLNVHEKLLPINDTKQFYKNISNLSKHNTVDDTL